MCDILFSSTRMVVMKNTFLPLSDEDKKYLKSLSKTRTIQATVVDCARILLYKADGVSFTSKDLRPTEENGEVYRDYEYKRLGTVSLLAGIDLLTGEAIPLVRDTHKSSDFIDFLKILDKKYPSQDTIRIILDNHSAHTSKETKRFLATMPKDRFEFVFNPKHGSWLNMIEGFFGKMTKQMLRGIRVNSKQELVDRIYQYFDEINKEPVVYHWKYKMDDIEETESASV